MKIVAGLVLSFFCLAVNATVVTNKTMSELKVIKYGNNPIGFMKFSASQLPASTCLGSEIYFSPNDVFGKVFMPMLLSARTSNTAIKRIQVEKAGSWWGGGEQVCYLKQLSL